MPNVDRIVPFADDAVRIHPTAVVGRGAELGTGVEIGPFSVVDSGVSVGDRTRLLASVHLAAGTEIGADCQIYPGAILGHAAQIRGLAGPGGGLRIGPRTIVREHVTAHKGSTDGATTIGADCLLLANCHVAHDCRIGDRVTIANGALLAGFVTVGDGAFISGNVVVHQYVRIGDLAMMGGQSGVSKDVPPFMIAAGRNRVCGTNIVGLRRAGMTAAQRQTVQRAYRILYRSGLSVPHALERLRAEPPSPEIDLLIAFVAGSIRGLCPARRRTTAGDLDE